MVIVVEDMMSTLALIVWSERGIGIIVFALIVLPSSIYPQ